MPRSRLGIWLQSVSCPSIQFTPPLEDPVDFLGNLLGSVSKGPNVARITLEKCGIGHAILIKGFSAEGHDSANTDYGGHYNERAGGLEDLTVLRDYTNNLSFYLSF